MNISASTHWLKEHQQKLTQQLVSGRMPHALLIVGATGSGKSQLIQWLSHVVNCLHPVREDDSGIIQACKQCKHCKLQSSDTFPDLLELDKSENTISVDSVRSASRFLESKAQIGHHKVVVVERAERMSVAASNALLKTLEEPTAGNLLVLSAANIEHLLPTIISRCQLIEIRPNLQQLTQNHPQHANINISYLPELADPSLAEAFQSYCLTMAQALDNIQQWQLFEQQLTEQERGLLWLERVVYLAQISQASAETADESKLPVVQKLAATLDFDSLNKVFQLILELNRHLADYPQANAAMLKQQLATTLFTLISGTE